MIEVHWAWFALYYVAGVAFILGARYYYPVPRTRLTTDDIVFAVIAAPALGLFLLCFLVHKIIDVIMDKVGDKSI